MEADKEMLFQLFSMACNEHMKFKASCNVEDLNRAILLYYFALSKIPNISGLHRQGLFNLSCALEECIHEKEQLEDLDKAIVVGQAAWDLVLLNNSI